MLIHVNTCLSKYNHTLASYLSIISTSLSFSELRQHIQVKTSALEEGKRKNKTARFYFILLFAVPATLKYKQCLAKDSRARAESEAVFEGFVTPKLVQYWSYNPKTFSASKNLQIKVRLGFGVNSSDPKYKNAY